MTDESQSLDIVQIQNLLPHRYPFLLIDRVIDYRPGASITAIKNVTVNEPFFEGHFPGQPIMPGVLIIEAMAQAGGVLYYMSEEMADRHRFFYLVAVDEARFRRPVLPGDRLQLDVRVARKRRSMWRFDCSSSVDGGQAVSAVIMCAPGEKRA
ncbi:MAG: 3-hydroxyacyl-ACP dehydratase FabZ [Woeseiaceae bacterium]